jgi:hypothetical protein
VITPRITRLVRVPDLQAMQAYLARRVSPAHARSMAVIVPSRSAAETLRETIESRCLADGRAVLFPDFITRHELYQRLHAQCREAPPFLSEVEREVIFRRAALDTQHAGFPAPFSLRAGLIVELLAFYDELRRRARTVAAFDRLLTGSLEPSADTDRGAERLLHLTRFLAAAFTTFELRLAATGRVDEHGLRDLLLDGSAATASAAYRSVIVTVADQAADPRGLWPCDYDLLSRVASLERLEIVATENVLAAGYHERIHEALPGIDEERFGDAAPLPVLAVPQPSPTVEHPRWIVCRDREEELVEALRSFKRGHRFRLDRTAIVFQRPLPYLYLAREVFTDAEVPYQTSDALPLAAEPYAAALDLIFSFLISEGSRASIVELLSSPHWSFHVDKRGITRDDVMVFDERLKDLKYSGGWDRLAVLAGDPAVAEGRIARRGISKSARLADALRAAADTAAELQGVREGRTASAQLSSLLAFIAAHERMPDAESVTRDAHLRARAAVLAILESLQDAHRVYDDAPVTVADLLTTIRRWIEGQTFSPRTGHAGVLLLDAASAGYADIDDLRLVGLVDADWPEKGKRNIFYPVQLLGQLGWSSDAERVAAARARFHDLMRLPRHRTAISTFTLEDDAIVPVSVLVEEIDRAGLPLEHLPADDGARVLLHEAISEEPIALAALEGEPRRGQTPVHQWLSLRIARTAGTADGYHGAAGPREPTAYAVSSLERYLECPFKYFAAHVLRLPEERADESGLTPQERGQFLHAVFEMFFAEWQASGRGSITTGNLAEAVSLFEAIAERQLQTLPESDRALERTYLLGSAAASGLAERAFAFEIEQGGEVIERLLEHELEGIFEFEGEAGVQPVRLRAKADRIDLMSDGTLRIVDYKLNKAPKPSRALQLPIYGVCAQQALEGRHQRSWVLGRAGYVAFREKNPFVSLGESDKLKEALAAGQARLLRAVGGIERGEFPPNPEEPFLCTRCAYSTVCRKDYVGDE